MWDLPQSPQSAHSCPCGATHLRGKRGFPWSYKVQPRSRWWAPPFALGRLLLPNRFPRELPARPLPVTCSSHASQLDSTVSGWATEVGSVQAQLPWSLLSSLDWTPSHTLNGSVLSKRGLPPSGPVGQSPAHWPDLPGSSSWAGSPCCPSICHQPCLSDTFAKTLLFVYLAQLAAT